MYKALSFCATSDGTIYSAIRREGQIVYIDLQDHERIAPRKEHVRLKAYPVGAFTSFESWEVELFDSIQPEWWGPIPDACRKLLQKLFDGCEKIVAEELDFRSVPVTALPDGLTVKDGLNLINSSITAIPKGTKVGGDLNLRSTAVKTLPSGLKVGGDLALSRSQIVELPHGLVVGRDLFLSNTQVKEIPEDLKVGRDLCLWGTNNVIIPKGFTPGRKIQQ
jgi:hypothetical protein